MSKYRQRLPQMDGGLFLADGGLETTLIFHQGIELPHFAAFSLLRDQAGTETLQRYYLPYIETARQNGFNELAAKPRTSRASWLNLVAIIATRNEDALPQPGLRLPQCCWGGCAEDARRAFDLHAPLRSHWPGAR